MLMNGGNRLLTSSNQTRKLQKQTLVRLGHAALQTIYLEDQGTRKNIETIEKQFGWGSPQMDSLFKRMKFQAFDQPGAGKKNNSRLWMAGARRSWRAGFNNHFPRNTTCGLTHTSNIPSKNARSSRERKSENAGPCTTRRPDPTTQGKEQIYGASFDAMSKGNMSSSRSWTK